MIPNWAYYLKKTVLVCFLFFSFYPSISQNKKVSGVYTMRIEKNMSDSQAEEIAIQRAKFNALKETFNTNMNAVNYLKLENDNGKSNMSVSSYSNSTVNGIWIKDLNEPEVSYEPMDERGHRYIKVEVSGKARKFEDFGFALEATPLNCINKKCETTDFKHEEDFYFYFQSPENGYLGVYLDDQTSVKMILPYPGMNSSTASVMGDKEYVFFKEDSGYPNITDEEEMWMITNSSFEANFVYVLFSKNNFSKPIMEIQDALKTTSSEAFKGWISELMADENMFVKKIPISITK
jgi:hypothetical protein